MTEESFTDSRSTVGAWPSFSAASTMSGRGPFLTGRGDSSWIECGSWRHCWGIPEQDFPAVHIAGTKGKGSTASMIAAALTAAGLRTGLYTSPHLHRLEERFVVDGQQCTEAELVALLSEIQQAVEQLDALAACKAMTVQGPTYFEITTAAALLHFQRKGVRLCRAGSGIGRATRFHQYLSASRVRGDHH